MFFCLVDNIVLNKKALSGIFCFQWLQMNPYSTHQVQIWQDAHKSVSSVFDRADMVLCKNVTLNLHTRNTGSSLLPDPIRRHSFVWNQKLSAEFCLISKSKSLVSAWGVYRGGCETAESRRWSDDKNEHIYWIILNRMFQSSDFIWTSPLLVNTNPISVIRLNKKQWKKITASQHCHVTLKTLNWRHSLVSNW